jgi:hypothetical protein
MMVSMHEQVTKTMVAAKYRAVIEKYKVHGKHWDVMMNYLNFVFVVI